MQQRQTTSNIQQQYTMYRRSQDVPRIGPMMGDTNMAATMNTVTFVTSPPAAMTEAPEQVIVSIQSELRKISKRDQES